jgi:high-affinity Fe2+/Pb2+ permease
MPTGSPAGPTGIAESAAPFTGSKTNVGAIAGGVVGGVVAAVLLGALIFFLCRRKTSQSKDE